MPFLEKTKPKIDISFLSKNDKPHNAPTHVTYHRDLDDRSIIVYWDTLMLMNDASRGRKMKHARLFCFQKKKTP